jgi:Protein of unknown function (DUF3159)
MHRLTARRRPVSQRCLSMVTISGAEDAPVCHMPSPKAALRHALPVVFEGIVAPVAVFYLFLLMAGLRGALLAALGWSLAAFVRRLVRGDRLSTVLILGLALLALRTGVSFAEHSTVLYFVPPMAWSAFVALVLIASAVVRRPFTQRFAHDFCPLDPDLVARPRVQQFFVRVSLLWAAVLLANTGVVLWLLLSTSLRAFVVERTAITWGLTAGAIACSIIGFTRTMRRDGIRVQWGDRLPA